MYKNMYLSNSYIFTSTSSGVNVFDLDSQNLINFLPFSIGVSSVYANDDYLYIGTPGSGIYNCPIATVTGVSFFSVYKQYPDITSNYVHYIHGAGNYLCATTNSGVDRFDSLTRDYTFNSNLTKCFQTTASDYYYIENPDCHIVDLSQNIFEWDYGNKVELDTVISGAGYNLTLVLPDSLYSYTTSSGNDLRVIDNEGNILDYYIDLWDYESNPEITVITEATQTDYFFVIYGNRFASHMGLPGESPREVGVVVEGPNSSAFSGNCVCVPSEYSTINGAIAAASDGDTILIDPGIHEEVVVINKHVHLRGNSTSVTNVRVGPDSGDSSLCVSFNLDDSTSYLNSNRFICFEGIRFSHIDSAYKDWVFNFSGITNSSTTLNIVMNKCYLGGWGSNPGFNWTNTDPSNESKIRFVNCLLYGVEFVSWYIRHFAKMNRPWSIEKCYVHDQYLSYEQCEVEPEPKSYQTLPASGYGYEHGDWIINVILRSAGQNYYTVNERKSVSNLLNFPKLHVKYSDDSIYSYEPGRHNILNCSYINDIFVTEGTSSFSNRNVIFLATSYGLFVIEENKGSEENSNKKIYLLNLDN